MVQERVGSLGIANFYALCGNSLYVDNKERLQQKEKINYFNSFALWFALVMGMGSSNSDTPNTDNAKPSSSVTKNNDESNDGNESDKQDNSKIEEKEDLPDIHLRMILKRLFGKS